MGLTCCTQRDPHPSYLERVKEELEREHGSYPLL